MHSLATSLSEKGHELLAIDKDPERLQEIRDMASQAVVEYTILLGWFSPSRAAAFSVCTAHTDAGEQVVGMEKRSLERYLGSNRHTN